MLYFTSSIGEQVSKRVKCQETKNKKLDRGYGQCIGYCFVFTRLRPRLTLAGGACSRHDDELRTRDGFRVGSNGCEPYAWDKDTWATSGELRHLSSSFAAAAAYQPKAPILRSPEGVFAGFALSDSGVCLRLLA
jgi:hypothetical protein